jgi:two-component system response regulator YesN
MDKNPISLPDFLIWTVELLKTLALLGQQKTGSSADSLSLGWLRKTMAYTEREFHRKLPLSELAELTGFHPSYFSRLFKKHTGLNYKDYLQNVRLGRSLELLEEGTSVSEAAELSGFQDVSYFIKVFRESRGITPYAYQKSLKK